MKLYNKLIKTYFLFLAFMIPLAFVQKCEDAYYLPKFILLVSGLVFLAPILNNIKNIEFDAVDKTVLLFLAAFFIGFFKSINKFTAFMSWLEWVMAAVLFLYARHFLSRKETRKAAMALTASACLASLYALLQAFNFDLPGWITNFSGRAFSTFGNPDFFGGYLVLMLPFTLLLSKNKIVITIAAGFLLLTLFLTQTRSSIFAFILSALLLLFLFRTEIVKNVKYIVIAIVIVAGLVLLTGKYSAVAARVKATGAGSSDLRGRVMMWKTGLNMLGRNIFTGIGIGNIEAFYSLYKNDNAGYFETGHLHNDFIDIAAQSGIIALGLFLAFIWFSIKRLIIAGNNTAKIALAGMVALLAHAFFNFPFFVLPTNACFFMALGLGMNKQIKKHHETPGFTMGTAVLSAIIMIVYLRATAGSISMNYAINTLDAKNYSTADYFFRKADNLYPFEKKYYYIADYYFKTGNVKAAQDYTEEFLKYMPVSKQGLMQSGILYAETKDYGKAGQKFDAFLKYYPDDAEALNDKAKVLYLEGKKQPAIDLYNKIISLYPLDETAHSNLTAIYINEEMVKQMWDEKKRYNNAKNAGH